MRRIPELVAALWLFIVAAQAVAHLVMYGLAPLPQMMAGLDFTPQYTVLMLVVIVAAVLGRAGQVDKR